MSQTRSATLLRALIVLASVPCLPIAAGAMEADQCIMSTTTVSEDGAMGHFRVDAPTDLEGGFVMDHLQRSVDGEQSTTAQVQHCATGRSVDAVISRVTWDETYEAPAHPADLVREAISSPVTFTLEEVVELLRSRGIEAEARSSDFESCGCAVFYPELVGDKTPWRR